MTSVLRTIIVICTFIFIPSLQAAQMKSADMPMEKGAVIQQEIPSDLDTSKTQQSESGTFILEYDVYRDRIPLNILHSWKFTLKSNDGKPVRGAKIIVQGEMPGHIHGLKTKPRMTYASGRNGIYIVEGMLFQMPGWWKVTCRIIKEQVEDTVIYNILVE